jgi:DNA-binding protein H-NS
VLYPRLPLARLIGSDIAHAVPLDAARGGRSYCPRHSELDGARRAAAGLRAGHCCRKCAGRLDAHRSAATPAGFHYPLCRHSLAHVTLHAGAPGSVHRVHSRGRTLAGPLETAQNGVTAGFGRTGYLGTDTGCCSRRASILQIPQRAASLGLRVNLEPLELLAPGRRRRSDVGQVLPVKYRGPMGEIWSGRGHSPKWLITLEAVGKNREQFRVKKESK